MITFKRFLQEIDHDDSVYPKYLSTMRANQEIDDTWKPLPVKIAFEIKGFECRWKPNGTDEYKLMLVDAAKNKSAMVLELKTHITKVPGGTLHGVIVTLLSSRPEYRGKNLALRVYEALINNGQILFSSDSQTSGSRKIWEDLIQGGTGVPFVLAANAAARWYIGRANEYEYPHAANVLLTGPFTNMDDEAYASEETRWVMIPPNLLTKAISDNAIQLPQEHK
jgi:hypothetical protein